MTEQEQLEYQIDAWNSMVERKCRINGTFHGVSPDHDDREFMIEIECYRGDDSADGFVGWWADDHGQMTHAFTPYEVFCDLP